ncbi:MAG: PrgI family protein [Minisyncoccia bacterium]
MQFQVPQFIEVEDKVVGPFTWKEFVYLAGGAGVCILSFKIFSSFFLALLVAAPFVTLSLLLTFYKVNEQPFINIFQSMLSFYINKKIYIWKPPVKEIPKKTSLSKNETTNNIIHEAEKVLTPEKLRELTWSLDVLDKK